MKRLFGLGTMLLCSTFYTPLVFAATVSGQIEVLKKGGRSAFDSAAHAVVYLTGVKAPNLADNSKLPPVIVNQKDKRFAPRLMPVLTNQTVHFYNREELEHNVFSTEEKNSFDLGRYSKDDFRPVSYPQTGKYKVYCNIHQKMILDIVVLDNPYFAVTDEQGNYRIDNVPKGDYQLNVWHIYGGEQTQPLTVSAEDMALGLLAITSTKVIRDIEKHKNKHGKKYKKKGRYRRR